MAKLLTEVWDGQSRSTPDASVVRAPDGVDWDRITTELQATQQMVLDHHTALRRTSLWSWTAERNVKTGLANLAGGMTNLVSDQALSNGSPINVTLNTAQLLVVLKTGGAPLPGSMKFTGTKVSPLGVETPAFEEDIAVDVLTTNGTSTTTNGTVIRDMENAYISRDQFRGTVTISTTDLNMTAVDVCSFVYAANPWSSAATMDAALFSATPTNSGAKVDILIYHIDKGGWADNKVTIKTVFHLESTGTLQADQLLSLRKISVPPYTIVPSEYDGIMINAAFYPTAQTYWDSINLGLWTTVWFPQEPVFV